MVSEAIVHNGEPAELYAVERNFKTKHKGHSNYCFKVPVIEEELEDPEEELLPVKIWLIFVQHTMSAAMHEVIKKMYYYNKPACENLEGEHKKARYAMK